mmetsp:Transcript_79706/g.251957  ORF Transcript_79706/g.251957 Transcript_79706/m.251957 type:complete len:286 (+) Transcript_79706:285-1142(+)
MEFGAPGRRRAGLGGRRVIPENDLHAGGVVLGQARLEERAHVSGLHAVLLRDPVLHVHGVPAEADLVAEGRELLRQDALDGHLGVFAHVHLRTRMLAVHSAVAAGELGDLPEYSTIKPAEAQRHDGDDAEHAVRGVNHEVALASLDLRPQVLHAGGLQEAAGPLVFALQDLHRAPRQQDSRLQGHGHHDVLVRHRHVQVREELRGFLLQGRQETTTVVDHNLVEIGVRRQYSDQGFGLQRQHLARSGGVQPAAVQPVDPKRHLADPGPLRGDDGAAGLAHRPLRA